MQLDTLEIAQSARRDPRRFDGLSGTERYDFPFNCQAQQVLKDIQLFLH